ncbi:nuclear transport factor 2 family protein [Cumulibacter manganitolerans]|uniref:nuclear transport factor 2 family protein n=1 Tax=Cumulibacter manganitolerans TaxID=1884992 RepID=UPI001E2978AE|nr:nuclear transport factor 2 family protein [Cumulibacter manganitolerans]
MPRGDLGPRSELELAEPAALTPSAQQLAGDYIAIWNETDPEARMAAIAQVWADDARYVDPLADVAGHDGIAAVVTGAQAQFPGWRFRLLGPVDAHHDQLRFRWELGPEGADAPVVGSDVALVDADGRLSLVLGFLDKVPAQV